MEMIRAGDISFDFRDKYYQSEDQGRDTKIDRSLITNDPNFIP